MAEIAITDLIPPLHPLHRLEGLDETKLVFMGQATITGLMHYWEKARGPFPHSLPYIAHLVELHERAEPKPPISCERTGYFFADTSIELLQREKQGLRWQRGVVVEKHPRDVGQVALMLQPFGRSIISVPVDNPRLITSSERPYFINHPHFTDLWTQAIPAHYAPGGAEELNREALLLAILNRAKA